MQPWNVYLRSSNALSGAQGCLYLAPRYVITGVTSKHCPIGADAKHRGGPLCGNGEVLLAAWVPVKSSRSGVYIAVFQVLFIVVIVISHESCPAEERGDGRRVVAWVWRGVVPAWLVCL